MTLTNVPTVARAERPQTLGEEIANSISHGVGLAGALVAFPLLVIAASQRGDIAGIVAVSVFATTMVLLYLASTLFHALPPGRAKRVFQVLDHSAIFLMIAGTYTPFTLVALGDTTSRLLLAFVWAVALVGIAIELAGSQRGDLALTATYIVLGWVILVQVGPLAVALPHATMALLVVGGVLYTVGAIFHHWRSLPFQNAIWHGFVLIAATCHYLAVLREIAPIRPAILP